MKSMKKWIALLLLAVMAVTLTACGSNNAPAPTAAPTAAPTQAPTAEPKARKKSPLRLHLRPPLPSTIIP